MRICSVQNEILLDNSSDSDLAYANETHELIWWQEFLGGSGRSLLTVLG